MSKLSEAEATIAFWKHLKNGSTAMLGVDGANNHIQPMTAFGEAEENLIWFFTRDDTEIAAEAAGNHEGRMVFIARDHEVYADISGELSLSRDKMRIDRFWGPMVAAWYPEGKDDPHLVLLRFAPVQGQVWVAKQGLIRYVYQATKANITKTAPNVGGAADVRFRN
jgi:general stress protein 26